MTASASATVMPRLGVYGAWLVHPREGGSKSEVVSWEEHGIQVEGKKATVWIESEAGKVRRRVRVNFARAPDMYERFI